mmetsp:Transcript_95918/g.219855  ORF Transcript_95918/g.219855 Transcript_95918/m.219855 type:complete len:271 (+) Transcript_95918:1748-2560(+)
MATSGSLISSLILLFSTITKSSSVHSSSAQVMVLFRSTAMSDPIPPRAARSRRPNPTGRKRYGSHWKLHVAGWPAETSRTVLEGMLLVTAKVNFTLARVPIRTGRMALAWSTSAPSESSSLLVPSTMMWAGCWKAIKPSFSSFRASSSNVSMLNTAGPPKDASVTRSTRMRIPVPAGINALMRILLSSLMSISCPLEETLAWLKSYPAGCNAVIRTRFAVLTAVKDTCSCPCAPAATAVPTKETMASDSCGTILHPNDTWEDCTSPLWDK